MAADNITKEQIEELKKKRAQKGKIISDEPKEKKETSELNEKEEEPELWPKESEFESDPIKVPMIVGYKIFKDNNFYLKRIATVEEDYILNFLRSISELTQSTKQVTTETFRALISDMINNVLQKTIKNKINYSEVPIIEKEYLFFKLFEITYGQKYKISQECNTCGEITNDFEFDLKQKAEVKTYKKEYPIEIIFDSSYNKTYKLNMDFPRTKNERSFSVTDKSTADKINEITLMAFSVTDGEELDSVSTYEMIENLDNKDRNKLRKKLSEISTYGLGSTYKGFVCQNDKCLDFQKEKENDFPFFEIISSVFSEILTENE